jgi:DNA/RNA-binding domain of Phe-tRNA-synthetase-like protein
VGLALEVSAELKGRARLGVLTLEDVAVREADASLAAEVEAYGAELRRLHGDVKSGEVPGADDARSLYKALGLDPTKTRPSSEALLRRVLKGEALYRINTLVDAMNLCSLRAQLPFGLYDLGKIEPPVVLRKGAPGESYEGIRKAAVNVESRPVLADARGAFGNPTSDSARTMVTLQTRSALVTVYAPASYGERRLGEVLQETEATLTRFCGGHGTERRVLG